MDKLKQQIQAITDLRQAIEIADIAARRMQEISQKDLQRVQVSREKLQ